MPNTFITMPKLRTIIRLYEDHLGLKTISVMARTSRNTVKKYINTWRSLGLSYDDFQSKSDSELHALFCISEAPTAPNPRRNTLESLLPTISKDLGKSGMTTLKQWHKYISEDPDGYGLTQFRIAIQRYRMINNPPMRMDS